MSIPKPGKKTESRIAHEKSPKFKKLQGFRAGVEGRSSCLKRSHGMRRSYMRGFDGTSTWCGYSIFSANLKRAARLKLASG